MRCTPRKDLFLFLFLFFFSFAEPVRFIFILFLGAGRWGKRREKDERETGIYVLSYI